MGGWVHEREGRREGRKEEREGKREDGESMLVLGMSR